MIIVLIIVFDQWTKKEALWRLENSASIDILKNRIELTLVKNTGAAFNIFSDRRKLLIGVTLPTIVFLGYYLMVCLGREGSSLLKLALSFVIGGGIGNLIDRIKKGFVVDFIYFKIKKFPVFNFADFFVFGGEFILIYLILTGKV